MRSKKIVLIGFQEQDNLGISYLAAMLLKNDFQVEVLDFRQPREVILDKTRSASPLIVGFSVIFQYYIQDFADLVSYLREQGIDCHFCAGGHYPSLRPRELLDTIPGLDSVVLFEGEYTLPELGRKIYQGDDWKDTMGIAYRQNSQIIVNELRPLVHDLDALPYPARERLPIFCLGKKCATLLASRGCAWSCAFCSIRRFYGTPPGKVKRVRSPAEVVQEMKMLYEDHGINLFFFQDDDFPVSGTGGQKWVMDFIEELEHSNLAEKFLWKISCRADEVSHSLFKEMKKVGLFLVYLGVESGNETGLKVLNKRTHVEQNIKAVDILRDLEIVCDFGFMLFDPSSTFESVRENIQFLRRVCGDGYSPTGFCKMIPYAATDVEDQLMKDNRLKGDVNRRDYDFLDARLNNYYSFLKDTFGEWMFTHNGLLNRLKWARYETAIMEKYFPQVEEIDSYKAFAKYLIAASNGTFFTVAEELGRIFEDSKTAPHRYILTEFQDLVFSKHYQFLLDLSRAKESFYSHNGLQ